MTASECKPKFRSRSHDAVIRVYDEAGDLKGSNILAS
jgi:hypothetical protein